jgi:hypothetical protein
MRILTAFAAEPFWNRRSAARYGLDNAKTLQRYDLPVCDAGNPFSVPGEAKLSMKVPSKTRAISLQITWWDGTEPEVSTIERN